jgi:hypothetical protein
MYRAPKPRGFLVPYNFVEACPNDNSKLSLNLVRLFFSIEKIK